MHQVITRKADTLISMVIFMLGATICMQVQVTDAELEIPALIILASIMVGISIPKRK